MNKKLLDLIVCPVCKGNVNLSDNKAELVCKLDNLAFPIKNDIPVMLETAARDLNVDKI
ncbi:MAG: hypothetical protein COC15_03290 [Legionellales bacterium]|nr:MAG: hypothetical protein COC15_03290 [Legionellales bacterium]